MPPRSKLSSTIYECLRDPIPMGIDAFRRGTWSSAAPMHEPRAHHTATWLGGNALLILGGRAREGVPTARAEIYDAHEQAWLQVPSMSVPRSHHLALTLMTGKVLVLGGTRLRGAQGAVASAELFDPATRTWSPAAPMSRPRARHAATVLRDGSVLVSGGCGDEGRLADAEIYDPRADEWRAIAPMRNARSDHSLTALDTGRVLAVGRAANGFDSCEAYDLASGRWLRRVNPALAPTAHSATVLQDGRVLIIGGIDAKGSSLASSDVYFPRWTTWGQADAQPACDAHAAVLLKDGGVALLGGAHRRANTADHEALGHCAIFDSSNGSWSRGPTMPRPRFAHTATLLPHNGIFVCGGYGAFDERTPLDTCDVLAPSWDGFSRIT